MVDRISMLLIGAGAMGGALLRAWLKAGSLDIPRSAVVDPNPPPGTAKLIAQSGLLMNPERDSGYDVCVLAVKPQLFPAVLPTLDWPGIETTLFVSIAAGKSVRTIRQLLQSGGGGAGRAPVVRAMPNLPVAHEAGMTVLCSDAAHDTAHHAMATDLMAVAGMTAWVEDDAMLDAGMALSGCGPAYVFLLTEAMAEAGAAAGLEEGLARKLARQTVIGSAAMLRNDARSAEEMRIAVSSPGGATAEAVNCLDRAGGMRDLLKGAVVAAVRRATELSD